jgi:hypothetical protein
MGRPNSPVIFTALSIRVAYGYGNSSWLVYNFDFHKVFPLTCKLIKSILLMTFLFCRAMMSLNQLLRILHTYDMQVSGQEINLSK